MATRMMMMVMVIVHRSTRTIVTSFIDPESSKQLVMLN
jgi:hypothetical protein